MSAIAALLALLMVAPTSLATAPGPHHPRPKRVVYEEVFRFAVEGDGKADLAYTLPCATDRAGNLWLIYTNQTDQFPLQPIAPSQVRQYTPGGRLRTAFGSFGAGPGQLQFPTDIHVGSNGRVYVADFQNARVSVFSAADGTLRRKWGLPGGAQPTRVAPTPDNSAAYVASGSAERGIPFRLYKFSLRANAPDGTPRLLWSVDATGLNGLAVDAHGNAWSGDRMARTITLYSAADGAPLQTIAHAVTDDSGVTSLAIDRRSGWLYALAITGTVKMYDVHRPTPVLLGQFVYPDATGNVAIAVDERGTVWIAEDGTTSASRWERMPCKERDTACAKCGGRHHNKCTRCTDPTWVVDHHTGLCRAPRCTDLDPACARCQRRHPLRCAACKHHRSWEVVDGKCKRRRHQ